MIVSRAHAFMFALAASSLFLANSAFAAPIPSTPGSHMLYDIQPAAEPIENVSQGNWGLKFTITAPISVTSLGLWDLDSNGFGTSHQVGLWDSNSALLASATIDESSTAVASFRRDGQWLFTALNHPVTLASGTYTLGFYNSLFDSYYVTSGNSMIFQSGASFSSGVGQFWPIFAMPTNSAGAQGYAGPNLQATAVVPEVGSIVMGSVGAVGLLLAVRLRRNYSATK